MEGNCFYQIKGIMYRTVLYENLCLRSVPKVMCSGVVLPVDGGGVRHGKYGLPGGWAGLCRRAIRCKARPA
jgi:hypothetical protein